LVNILTLLGKTTTKTKKQKQKQEPKKRKSDFQFFVSIDMEFRKVLKIILHY